MKTIELPLLTNQNLPLKSLRTVPGVQSFFEALEMVGCAVNLITIKPGQGVELGSRHDYTAEGALQLMNQMKRVKAGVLLLKLSGIDDPSYATMVAGYARQKNWPVVVFGMRELEQNKLTSEIDLQLKDLPKGLKEATQTEILANFDRPLYREKFQQKLARFPAYPDPIKQEVRALLAKEGRVADVVPLPKILNLVLVLEFWDKYETLLNGLLETLSKNEKNESYFHTKLILGLWLGEKQVAWLRDYIQSSLSADDKDVLTKLGSKDEFLQYLGLLLSKDQTKNLFARVLYGLQQMIVLPRLREEAHVFSTAEFLSQPTAEETQFKSNYIQQVLQIKQNFFEATSTKGKNAALYEQEAKKAYITHLASYFLAVTAPKFIPPGIKNQQTYAKLAQSVINLPVYAVDRILLNPWINATTTLSFIVSKVLQQTNLTNTMVNDLLLQASGWLSPSAVAIRNYLENAEKEKSSGQAKRTELSLQKYIDKGIEWMAEFDYILLAEPGSNRVEIAFSCLAKESLGLPLDPKDGQNDSSSSARFGYQPVKLFSWTKKPSGEVSPDWLRSLYQKFLKRRLTVLYRSQFMPEMVVYQGQINQPLYYFLFLLARHKIYLGYHQAFSLLQNLEIVDAKLSRVLGYSAKLNNLFGAENPVVGDWLLNSSKEREKPSLTKMMEDQRQYSTSFKKFFQEKADISPAISPAANNFVLKFIEKLAERSVFDLFSDAAYELLPIYGPLEALKIDLLEHFRDNFGAMQKFPPAFVVAVPENWEFLSFFGRDLSLDLEAQRLSVFFYPAYSPLANASEWKKNELFKFLEARHGTAIEMLRQVWSRLLVFHTRSLALQSSTALLVMHEMLDQNFGAQKNAAYDAKALKQVDPEQALAIYNNHPSEVEGLWAEDQPGSVLSLREVLEGFYNLNKSKKLKNEYADLFAALNHQLGLIPLIRYASINIKLFRQNLARITHFFQTNIADITAGDISEINQVILSCWTLIQEILKEESQVPLRYRYLNQALNNLELKINQTYKQALLQFFKSSFDAQGSSTKMKDLALHGLHLSLKFKALLEKKSFYCLFPLQAKKEDVQGVIESLRIYKGLNTQLYVDRKSALHLEQDLVGYLAPEYLIELRNLK